MPLFFVTFFVAYGSMHLYVFLRARAALHFGYPSGLVLALFMGAMLFAPVLIRQAEKQGLEASARLLSYLGYTWLGLIFLFMSASLVIDLYRLLIRSAELLPGLDLGRAKPAASLRFYLPLALSLLISLYGYGEALHVRAEHVTIETPKLPAGIDRIRVVQISDVHLGLIIREERLSRILGIVRDAGPDLLVSTGDLVDGQINGLPGLAEMFNGIRPQFGKYAVTGNHELYAGLEQALGFIRRSGFRLLRDEAVDAADFLSIAGVDDRAVRPWEGEREGIDRKVLSQIPKGKFTIFLKHRPLVEHDAAGLFDLQLSGHVHQGQIFPFSIATRLYYPVHSGLAVLESGARLYVSRGTGTWGPPVRFLSPPEVTIVDIVHTGQDKNGTRKTQTP